MSEGVGGGALLLKLFAGSGFHCDLNPFVTEFYIFDPVIPLAGDAGAKAIVGRVQFVDLKAAVCLGKDRDALTVAVVEGRHHDAAHGLAILRTDRAGHRSGFS